MTLVSRYYNSGIFLFQLNLTAFTIHLQCNISVMKTKHFIVDSSQVYSVRVLNMVNIYTCTCFLMKANGQRQSWAKLKNKYVIVCIQSKVRNIKCIIHARCRVVLLNLQNYKLMFITCQYAQKYLTSWQ